MAESKKRKLNLRTLEEKYNVIRAIENGQSRKSICEEYDLKHNTLADWVKKAEKIKSNYESGDVKSKTKKRKVAKYEDVEIAVEKWFNETTAKYDAKSKQKQSIDREMIIEKAEEFAKELGVTNFSASSGWFSRFKDRHNIVYKRICGEAKSADLSKIDEWKVKQAEIIRDYAKADIFNADETALFFKCTPDKTYCKRGEPCVGGKQPKDRVSILVTANMNGTEKLPILVIGKSKKPRCFKNVRHLPLDYEANKKAWMTSTLFSDWLHKIDRRMHTAGRRIVMIVDNCSAHPHVAGLRATKLVFLPPNTTSLLQPMDQGIINNLKFNYRKLLAKKKLACLEAGSEHTQDLLNALYTLRTAWTMVKTETIQNCFMRAFYTDSDIDDFAGFTAADIPDGDVPVPSDDTDDDDAFYEAVGVDKETFADLAITADDGEQCIATLTDAEIIESVKSKNDDPQIADDNDDDDATADVEPRKVTTTSTSEALKSLDSLRIYFSNCDTAADVDLSNEHLDFLQTILHKQSVIRVKQSKLNFVVQ